MDYLELINEGFATTDENVVRKNLRMYLMSNRTCISFRNHPLGFKYFRLGKISNQEEFRLHYWGDSTSKQDEELQIHNHSFDFESYVVQGSLINHTYIVKDSTEPKGTLYDVLFENEKSSLVLKKENCCAELQESITIGKGEFYKMSNLDFHESFVPINPTVTLLKISKPGNKTAQVFSYNKLFLNKTYERINLSIDANTRIIDKIISFTAPDF